MSRASNQLREAGEPSSALTRAHTDRLNAERGPTLTQWLALLLVLGGLAACAEVSLSGAVDGLHAVMLAVFGATTLWRVGALALARPPPAPRPLSADALPTYTIIAPLYREADMVPALLRALGRIEYPRDRLEVLLALEWDDIDTRAAITRLDLPPEARVVIVPPGAPRTKPRACNAAFREACGERVVVYDAEDRPHPGQLLEAAARFAATGPKLACLQAPLRIPLTGSFTMRQFALEYAALFEVMLPALARIGAPFPLGGTSNHFRTEALRSIGGWDPWNVTEDADLGFRLGSAGYRLGVLRSPTLEDAPRGSREWLPQRARWLKGYMQTWGVHMRRPWAGGVGWLVALQATVGLTVVSAAIHAPTAVVIGLQIVAATTPYGYAVSLPDVLLFGGGWGAAVLCMSGGASRAGVRPRLSDALLAPLYWSLQSIAFWRALHQLVRRPHHWDKTPHHPPAADADAPTLDEAARPRVVRAA